MKRFLLITLASLVTLAGCHSFKKENVQPPTPLNKDFKSTVQVTRLWRTSVGDGAKVSGVRLRPTVVDGVLYADSTDGKLAASSEPLPRRLSSGTVPWS
jgi:outer membrane protein assembly factor BamB